MFVKEISLTPAVIQSIVDQNGPTFKPLSGGKLRCNQLPELGRITAAQADALRSRCYPRKNVEEKKPALVREELPTAILFGHWGDANCPRCGVRNKYIRTPKKVRCHGCQQNFKAID